MAPAEIAATTNSPASTAKTPGAPSVTSNVVHSPGPSTVPRASIVAYAELAVTSWPGLSTRVGIIAFSVGLTTEASIDPTARTARRATSGASVAANQASTPAIAAQPAIAAAISGPRGHRSARIDAGPVSRAVGSTRT